MAKIRCLVSAGPTREFFDPVRYISNPSTGKMGYALADAAARAGWYVELVSGPVSLPVPEDVEVCRVVTGDEMFRAIDCRFDQCDILIMVAAVTDFRPVKQTDKKLKKTGKNIKVEFEPTIDILKTIAARKKNQVVVGFAAETHEIEDYARQKLKEKNCDFMVANRVGQPGEGFAADTNSVTVFGPGSKREVLGPLAKREIATRLIARFRERLEKKEA